MTTDEQELTGLDLVRVAIATQDHAHRWYGRHGGFTFSKSDAARYVSEGALKQYPLKPTWRAVAAHIEAHPEVLTFTDEQEVQAQRDRAQRCAEIADEACEQMVAGWFVDALAMLDAGELVDPDYRIGFRSWDDLREIVRRRQALAESAG